MADVSNMKINERLNLRVTKIHNKNWENWFISKGNYKNWQNCKMYGISNGQPIQKISNFFSQILVFQIGKILDICYFPTWKIPKISNLENSKIFRFEKFQKNSNLKNSKNFGFRKFQKLSIWKILKMSKL